MPVGDMLININININKKYAPDNVRNLVNILTVLSDMKINM